MPRAGACLSASALLVLLTASSPDGAAGQTAAPQAPLASLNETIFPVAIKSGNRYLVDATDRPFLIHGDTAWSLIVQLKRPDAEIYLEDRRVRGFNTILVNLLEHQVREQSPCQRLRSAAVSQAPVISLHPTRHISRTRTGFCGGGRERYPRPASAGLPWLAGGGRRLVPG